ncbi:hypothetical protein, partial [Helicobacter sp. 11S02596-1]|uniref:hypothetical protein n=1 Tax=Helicobacter sp. 11S02596-1 TaxID=1476194 RepID=UPI001C5E2795
PVRQASVPSVEQVVSPPREISAPYTKALPIKEAKMMEKRGLNEDFLDFRDDETFFKSCCKPLDFRNNCDSWKFFESLAGWKCWELSDP